MITENNIKHKNDDFLKKKSPQKHRSSINSTELPEFSESNENSKLKNSIPDLLDMSLSDLTDCDEKKLFKKNVQTSIQLTPYEESLYLKPEFLIDLIKTINAMKNTLKPNKSSLKEIFMSKEKCVRVEIRIVFLKIGEIETIKEQFQAEAFIEAKWKEPSIIIEVSQMN